MIWWYQNIIVFLYNEIQTNTNPPKTPFIMEKYYIIDCTSNSCATAYVCNEDGDIIHCNENCMSFDNHKEAQNLINNKGWQDWAGIISE
jgi:hypothetical protein